MSPTFRRAFFWLALGSALVPALAPLSAAIVDGTAAKVGKLLIMVQDARFRFALDAFRAGQPPPKDPDATSLKRTVQRMIFEEMVAQEAITFQFPAVPMGDAETAVKARNAGSGRVHWKEILRVYSKTEKEALELVRKSLLVAKFVDRKVETMTPIITDAEAERYYRDNQSNYSGENFNAVKPTIVLLLKKQKVEKGLEDWIGQLKSKYGVVNYLERK